MARSSPKRRAQCTAPWSGEVARACKVTRGTRIANARRSCAGERSAVPPPPHPGPLLPRGEEREKRPAPPTSPPLPPLRPIRGCKPALPASPLRPRGRRGTGRGGGLLFWCLAPTRRALPLRHLVIVLGGFGRWLRAADRVNFGVGELFHGEHLTFPALFAFMLVRRDNHDSPLPAPSLQPTIPKVHPQMTKLCALCQSPLKGANKTKEHVIPNAIGGRKKVGNFICKPCNDNTGRTWDEELTKQLQPLCTILGVKRERKSNREVLMRDSNNKQFTLHPDASISIPHTIRSEHALGDKTEIIIEASSTEMAKRILAQEVAARPDRPDLNVEEILSNAASLRDQIQSPLRMSLPFFLAGDGTGRSIIKSCLALADQKGVSVEVCENARRYLDGTGDACFGHYNEFDLVKNRPVGLCFHCVGVYGDPSRGHIVAYVEYFSYQRIVARLSDNYCGKAFDICYAIDPVAGKELALEVAFRIFSRRHFRDTRQ